MQKVRTSRGSDQGTTPVPAKEHDGATSELGGSVVTLSADFICAMVSWGDKKFSQADAKNKGRR